MMLVADELPGKLPEPGDVRVVEIEVDTEPKAFLVVGLDGSEAPGVKVFHPAYEETFAEPLTNNFGRILGV